MLLSKIVLIKKSISRHQEDLYHLTKSKGSGHPEVLKAREQLDRKRAALQQQFVK